MALYLWPIAQYTRRRITTMSERNSSSNIYSEMWTYPNLDRLRHQENIQTDVEKRNSESLIRIKPIIYRVRRSDSGKIANGKNLPDYEGLNIESHCECDLTFEKIRIFSNMILRHQVLVRISLYFQIFTILILNIFLFLFMLYAYRNICTKGQLSSLFLE